MERFSLTINNYGDLRDYYNRTGAGEDLLRDEIKARGWNRSDLNSVQLDVLADQADEYALQREIDWPMRATEAAQLHNGDEITVKATGDTWTVIQSYHDPEDPRIQRIEAYDAGGNYAEFSHDEIS